MQPCISPVWDTGLAVRSLVDAGVPRNDKRLVDAVTWMVEKQIVNIYGDWAVKNRTGKPGGWAFEFENNWYPDVDDTAVVAMAIAGGRPPRRRSPNVDASLARAMQWVETMQCTTGGWGAFDVDNDQAWLNRIPYGDLKAMIDPSTADVTARVLEMHVHTAKAYELRPRLARSKTAHVPARRARDRPRRVVGPLGRELRLRHERGARSAFGPARVDRRIDHAVVRAAPCGYAACKTPKAAGGETTDSHRGVDPTLRGTGPSTASQTALALIGLIEAVQRLPSLTGRVRTGNRTLRRLPLAHATP